MLCGCYNPCCSSCYPSNCTTTSTTTSTTTTTTICPDPEVCEEIYNLECVEYTGDNEDCFGIITGDYIDSTITTLFTLLQTTTTLCYRPEGLQDYTLFNELSYDGGITSSGITSSFDDACFAYNELQFNPSATLFSFLAQSTKVLVGSPMYDGDIKDCSVVDDGYYLIFDGTYYSVIHIIDGEIITVDNISGCTTTTTSTSTTTTTTLDPCPTYTLYNNDPDNDQNYTYYECTGISTIFRTSKVLAASCKEVTNVSRNTLTVGSPLVDVYEGAICDTLTTTTTTIAP